MVFCAGFFFGIARGTPLLGWDFESGVQGWTGVNASVATVASTRESGASALSVTMNANAVYDGGEVDITSAIPALAAVFQAQGLVEVSAWVKIPEASEKNCIVAMSLRTTNGEFTLHTGVRKIQGLAGAYSGESGELVESGETGTGISGNGGGEKKDAMRILAS